MTSSPHTTSPRRTPHPRIDVRYWDSPDKAAIDALVSAYDADGFALVHATHDTPSVGKMLTLAKACGLRDPYTPPDCLSGPRPVSAALPHVVDLGTGSLDAHPARTDGPLAGLLDVRTSLRLYERPGSGGGATHLVDVCAAFTDLKAEQPVAADALFAPVLCRHGEDGRGRHRFEPAFGYDNDGRIITRWGIVPHRDHLNQVLLLRYRAHLRRALTAFEKAAKPGSPYRTDVPITAGDVLVVANRHLTLGRDEILGEPSILRVLYPGRPTTGRPRG